MLQALRRKLTRWYLALLAVLLAAYSLGTYGLVHEILMRSLDEANHHLTMAVTTAGSDIATLASTLEGLPLSADERVEVLDASGRVVAATGARMAMPPAVAEGVATVSGPEGWRSLTVPVRRDGTVVGHVRASHGLAVANQALQWLVLILAGLLPLAVLAAWGAGNWLARLAVQPVESAIARERAFTRDASHELRTPLAVILAHAELARETPGLPGQAAEKLQLIERTARGLADLAQDLLTLSREDAGVQGAALRFELADVVEEELELLAPLADERGVTVAVAALPESAPVQGEPGRVAQAVRNLLDNAIRYVPAGGRVAVRLEPRGRQWALTVGNDGPPIGAFDRARLFDRFYRAAAGEAAHPGGSGLGLAIVKAIATAHGGDVTLASGEAESPAFTMTLPRA